MFFFSPRFLLRSALPCVFFFLHVPARTPRAQRSTYFPQTKRVRSRLSSISTLRADQFQVKICLFYPSLANDTTKVLFEPIFFLLIFSTKEENCKLTFFWLLSCVKKLLEGVACAFAFSFGVMSFANGVTELMGLLKGFSLFRGIKCPFFSFFP